MTKQETNAAKLLGRKLLGGNMAQIFYREQANQEFPEGCKCGNNGGGDCDWCRIYYGWDETSEPDGPKESWDIGGML